MASSDDDLVVAYIAAFGTPRCKCGDLAPLRTSWTDVNPGRRFFGCHNYGTIHGRCDYFVWVDPDYPERAKIVINGLLRKTERLEKEIRVYERVERKFMVMVGKLFVWGVGIVAVGVPFLAAWINMKK